MKRVINNAVLAVLFFLSLAGCLQVNTVIKVNPDGSGTVEETFLMRKEFVQQMKAIMQQMTGQTGQMMLGQTDQKLQKKRTGGVFDIFDEAKLKKKVSNMGKGVTYVSGERIATDKLEGYRAVYAFTDINKLKINQNPSESVPAGSVRNDKGSKNKEELVMFHFTRGNPSTLIIKLPDNKAAGKPGLSSKNFKTAETKDQQSELIMAQMKKMFEGMKITMAVEVQGSIARTNADHREGSRVTLMELDFDRLLEAPEDLKKFSRTNPETLEEAKKLMKDLPGIKVDLNKEVIIKFR